mgnify:CR=1 FL=1
MCYKMFHLSCDARCTWTYSSFFCHWYCQSQWITLKLIEKRFSKKILDTICCSLGLCVLIAIKLDQSNWTSNMYVEELECCEHSPLIIDTACFISMRIMLFSFQWQKCWIIVYHLSQVWKVYTTQLPWFSVQWAGLLYCNLADEKCKEWWCSNISFMLFPIAAEEEELRRYVVHKSDNAALLSPRTISLHSGMLKSCNWQENSVFFCTFICCWMFTLCHIAYLLLLKIFMFIWCLTCVVIVKESGTCSEMY